MRDRVQRIKSGSEPDAYSSLFATSPTTHLSDDKDLLVLQLRADWQDFIAPHPKAERKVLLLALEAVDHHLVMTPSAFEPEAHPESILMRAR